VDRAGELSARRMLGMYDAHHARRRYPSWSSTTASPDGWPGDTLLVVGTCAFHKVGVRATRLTG